MLQHLILLIPFGMHAGNHQGEAGDRGGGEGCEGESDRNNPSSRDLSE
jgi:hypothetical protein